MKKMLMFLLFVLALFIPLALDAAAPAQKPAGGKEVLLVDLTPVSMEWGTDKWDAFPDMPYGEKICDYGGGWPRNPAFWPGETKIIKEYAKDFKPDNNKPYRSIEQEYFAVAGELMTGVGLLSRRTEFYYWIEYEIPAGAKNFDGSLYVTDDTSGGLGNGNDMWFQFKVSIDGKDIIDFNKSRGAPDEGSGEMVDTIAIPIPEGAKVIRFYLKNVVSGNGNANTELLINDGKFILK